MILCPVVTWKQIYNHRQYIPAPFVVIQMGSHSFFTMWDQIWFYFLWKEIHDSEKRQRKIQQGSSQEHIQKMLWFQQERAHAHSRTAIKWGKKCRVSDIRSRPPLTPPREGWYMVFRLCPAEQRFLFHVAARSVSCRDFLSHSYLTVREQSRSEQSTSIRYIFLLG